MVHVDDSFRDRRLFLKLISAAGASTVFPACGREPSQESAFFKDTTAFIPRGSTNLEARLENMGGFITPAEQFFVRNNDRSLDVDADAYRLVVEGDAVETPLALSMADLVKMPSHTVFSTLECGGNQRSFFSSIVGQPARGTQWGRGAVGMAVWTGTPLRRVLLRAGMKESAKDVQLVGLDEGAPEAGFRRVMPVEKAMDADTLLAYTMNGAPLPKDHGYPLRALVPGWVGSSSIKWLGRIEVSSEKIWGRNNTTSYVLIGDDYAPEGEARGRVATVQSIKSVLALPWPAVLKAGRQLIRGYAHSPHAPIDCVWWSADDQRTWQRARIIDPVMRWAWARFEFEWQAAPGTHRLSTRAEDSGGHAQPDWIPHNEKGYLFNMPLPHPVTVR